MLQLQDDWSIHDSFNLVFIAYFDSAWMLSIFIVLELSDKQKQHEKTKSNAQNLYHKVLWVSPLNF